MTPADDFEPTTDSPRAQYLAPEYVLGEMAEFGHHRIMACSVPQILVLGAMGGAFITAGALFSVLLGAGVSAPGPQRLLEGLGFSAGFFFVILSHAALFTEANVVLPATLLGRRSPGLVGRVARFWALAWIGNLVGALFIGYVVHAAQHYPPGVSELLSEIVTSKMAWRDSGGVGSWGEIVLSGILANWLVGMAAFFAIMGRTIIGKFVPVFLAVTLFVSANLQHSPANMGFFSLIMPSGEGPGWGAALVWSVIPAGIGNMIGGTLMVVLPLWFALNRGQRAQVARRAGGADATPTKPSPAPAPPGLVTPDDREE